MNHDISSGHSHNSALAQLVDRSLRHWETRRQLEATQRDRSLQVLPAFTVALSREAGTQGTAVAQEVGRLLGWQMYDHELLEQIAHNMGLRTHLLESVDERKQSWLRETAEAFLSAPLESTWGPLVTESGYVHHLVKTVLALGVHGECVIVGRGAPFILPMETTLRVRLVAPLRERVAVLGRRLGLSEREAARKVRTLDRERNDFVHDHFFRNPNEPWNYDLMLNTSRLSVTQCAELIVDTLQRVRGDGKK